MVAQQLLNLNLCLKKKQKNRKYINRLFYNLTSKLTMSSITLLIRCQVSPYCPGKPEARGGSRPNPTSKEQWLRGHRRAQRSYPTLKVRKGSGEEIPLVRGKEQWLHFAGAAVKRYPTPKVRETQVRRQVLQEGIRGQTH